MKEYDVCVPITGVAWIVVQAKDKQHAIKRALESEHLTLDKIEDWEAHRVIVEGNVLHATTNEAYAQLAFGEEDE